MAIVWYVLFASFYLLKSSEAQTLSLSVTPPSPVVGQEVTFTCTASQDFTDSTYVVYRKNGEHVGQFGVTSTYCTSVILTGQNYTLTCGSPPKRQLSLTIPAAYVTEDEHGTNWICNTYLVLSNTVQLTLSVPVSMVTITTDGVYRPSVTIPAGNTRTFTCTTTASRPVARLSWFRGDNNITDQAGTATDQETGDDKYTRQQSLTITGMVNDVDSGLKCEAVNIEGRTPVSSQTSNIIVQYSQENISVTHSNLTDDDTSRELRCIPDGNPKLFKFSKWQHRSIYGQLIRELDGVASGQESVLTIPDPGLDTRYQDTGYYVCRVENGVPDRNNQSVFSRSVYVSVKSPPVFVADESLFTGQQEHAAVITVPFYTPTGYQQVELTKGNINMDNRFILSTIPANVSVSFFGRKFAVRGFLAVISVQKLRESDFGSYVLTVTNDVGSQQFEFDLKKTAASASAKDSSIHHTGVAMLSTGVVLLLISIGIIGCLILRKGRLSITNKTTTSKPEATIQFAELNTSRRGNGEEERSTYEEIGRTDRSELALDSPACDASEYENTRVLSQGNSAYESLQGRQKPNVYEELASPRNDDTGDNEYSNADTGEET